MESNTMLPKFVWRAVYSDNTILEQVNGEVKNKYEDIDRTKLRVFELYDRETKDIKVRLLFKNGQRLIWRRREFLKPTSQGVKITGRLHIIGKQETKNGKNYQGFLWLFEPEGYMEIGERFIKGHPFFDDIELLDIEK